MEHFAKRTSEYLLLRSEQLVGAALIIVVKQDLTKSMRSIEATTKKVSTYGFAESEHFKLTRHRRPDCPG